MTLEDLKKEIEETGYRVKIVPYGVYGSENFEVIIFEKYIGIETVKSSLERKGWKEKEHRFDGVNPNKLDKWFSFKRHEITIELQSTLMGKEKTNLFLSADKPF